MADLDALLPSAKTFAQKLAEVEAEKAAKALEQMKEAEAEKQELLEAFRRPSGVSDEEGIRRGMKIIERAVANGLTEVQFYRFPNTLCTDKGRAINQGEAGWETTLTGVPREIYEFWKRQQQPRGYHIRYEVVDYPGGMPGDIGIILSWH